MLTPRPAVVGLLVAILAAVIAGCGLTPVPPPLATPQSTPSIQPSATASVSPAGFTNYERAALRVRKLGCGNVSSGSAFAIADRVLVTNRHVVAGAALLQLSTYDGHDIEVIATGSAVFADLALVWTKDVLPATLPLAPSNPSVGTNVTAVGFPLGGKLTTTRGKVLGYDSDPLGWSSFPMLVNDAPIEHGSSGSPLINDRGQLVGVVYAADGDKFAVPVEVLRQMLDNPNAYAHSASCGGAP